VGVLRGRRGVMAYRHKGIKKNTVYCILYTVYNERSIKIGFCQVLDLGVEHLKY